MNAPTPSGTRTLPEFIAEIGDTEAARLFDAELRTVQAWRRRERWPRPETAQQMVAVSGGRLTMDGIYGADPKPKGSGG